MSETAILSHQESLVMAAPPDSVYQLIADITRTGEWSPVCVTCWWDDEAEAGQVGAWFTGRNQTPDRTWETRSELVAADPGREFAWIVGGTFARWGFTLAPAGDGTTLTQSWEFLPGGIAMFEEKFGEDAPAQIALRTQQALHGIPKSLVEIKRICESDASEPDASEPVR